MLIMTLLGLAFVLAGQTESRIAVNHRNSQQALHIAEGGMRAVKKWFDAPTGTSSYLVPTTSQMDRSQRWVDDNNDGTYGAYASAASPYNVVYRDGTDDPFEKPYRGSPALAFMGTEAHPDIVISESGSSGETAYLSTLNATLFADFLSSGQQGRISRIDVYGPPMINIGGTLTRYGIATIKVTAGIYEFVGTAAVRRVATRIVKAVINEAPYTGPLGPLQSNTSVDATGDFKAHWGKVTAVTAMNLHSGLNEKVDSGVPWYSRHAMLQSDNNGDGTAGAASVTPFDDHDDKDHDGTNDFEDWIANGASIEDPWLRFWSEGSSSAGPCVDSNCQPLPYDVANPAGSGDNHSNIFENVDVPTFPEFNYQLWKNVAQSGAQGVHYYASDGAGTGTYKLNGSGASVTMRDATDGNNGLFFFDTATNTAPVDTNGDNTYDNLSDEISLNGGGYATTGNGNAANRTIYAPGEPYIDANANGMYDSTEYFVDLTYPNSIDGGYAKNGLRRVADGYTRQVPADDAASDGHYSVKLNLYGVMYMNGKYSAKGNWTYYGSVVTKEGMLTNSGAGTPDIYFDERLITGGWPPADIGVPRTIITAWETDL